ncbi:MAG: hypothetical protein ACK4UJ_06540 [Leptonema sp. (in: bacteria)]
MKNKVGINNLYFLEISILFVLILNCYTPPIKKIPEFHYEKIFENYSKTKSLDSFPIIVQPGEERDFSLTDDGFLVYSSNSDGNFDIYLRDLKTVLKLKIIEHPTEQTNPILKKINKTEYLLAYESNEQDLRKDIYIVSLKPKEIFDLYINKRETYNYWNFSLNISSYIESYFEKSNLFECKGKFPELFPLISDDGKFLFYISNRCTNKFFLWKVPLKNGKPQGKPEILFNQEIFYPYLNKNFLIFNLIENQNITSQIGILNFNNNEFKILKPKAKFWELKGIVIKPKLNFNLTKIFAIHITKDTNRNSILDEFDQGNLISLDLEGNLISQITNDNKMVYHYDTSLFFKDNIVYISDIYQEKDIFLTTYEGNIPKKENPFEQLEYSKNLENTPLYFLSLQKIFEYFSEDKNFLYIEGEVFYELLSFLKKNQDESKLLYFKEFYELRKKENPFIEIGFFLRKIEKEKEISFTKIQNYEKLLSKEDPYQKDYFYYRLGQIFWNIDKNISINYLNQVSKDFLLFSKVSSYIFLYHLQKEREDRKKWQEKYLYTAIEGNSKNLFILIKEIEKEFEKKSIDELEVLSKNLQFDFLKYYSLYIKAEKYYLAGELNLSLQQINSIEDSIRNHFKEYLRLLKLKTLKLKIDILKKLNLERELLSARNEFINSYKRNLGIELDKEEIQSIIEASNQFVRKYRKAAISIYENLKERFSLLDRTPILDLNLVEITSIDADNLKDFCSPNSLAGKLIDDYNYLEYEIRYENLCKSVTPYLANNEKKIPPELVFEANQLMYLSSYAYANLINILFINVNLAGIFLDFHQKWSNYYHRLKVDLAVERFNYSIDWQERKALLITKEELTNLLVEKDPFDGVIFNDLLYGYREVAGKLAQENLEFSVLYGHAYTLIQKSIEREKFYDNLFLKGFSISNDELIRRKKNILLDLKEAENQLLYILSIDPTYEDAILLLTYLYSYIDTRREKSILNPPGYLDRLLRFLTKRKPKKLTDGIFFRVLYNQFFPKRLYETNLLLLESTLKIKKSFHQKISKEMYLSLALNYYKIFNYKKTIEYLNQIEPSLESNGNYLEKTLFYYYYAKSNYYEGNYGEAIKLLDKVQNKIFEHYEKEKRKINIALSKNARENQSRTLKDELSKYETQIVSILILKSLCRFYQKEFYLASLDLKEALQYLESNHEIKKYNVYNFLSLSFLNNKDYQLAFYYANLALKEIESIGLSRNDDEFLPQTVGGRLLGLFINFNEDFAVIGESKIPREISSLRSYSLSLGILQKTFKNQNDYLSTLEMIERKKEVIKKKDLDVILGKESYVSLLNQEGVIYFNLKNYKKSLEAFYNAYQFSLKNNLIDDYSINLKNMFSVVFYEIEEKLKNLKKEENQNLIENIDKLNKELIKFKENYFKLKKEQYIKIKTTENPNYKFKELDLQILLEQVERELREFYLLDSLVSFYRLLIDPKNPTHPKEIQAKFKKFIENFSNESSKNLIYFRGYINYLKTLLILSPTSYLDSFLKEWELVHLEIQDFALPLETIELYQIKGDYFYLKKNCNEAKKFYKFALDALESSIYFLEVPLQYESLVEKYIYCLINEKDYKMILDTKEKYRFLVLQNLFFSLPIGFENKTIDILFSEIQSKIRLLKETKEKETKKQFEKKSSRQEREELKKLIFEIEQYKKEFTKELPEFKDYLIFDSFYFNQINPNLQYLYLFLYDNQIHCISVYKKQIRYFLAKDNHLDPCIQNKEFVVIPDRNIYIYKLNEIFSQWKDYHFALRNSILDNSPVVIDSPEKINFIKNKNYFNQHMDFLSEDWTLKKQEILPLVLLLSNREEGIVKYFLKKPNFSKVKLIKSENNKNNLYNASNIDIFSINWILYDFYSHFGVASFEDNNHFLWGSILIQRENLKSYISELSNKYFNEGLTMYSKDPKKALEMFLNSYSIFPETKKAIYIISTLIETSHPKSEYYLNLLWKHLKEKNNKTDLLFFYTKIILAYSKIHLVKAKEFFNVLLKEFPNYPSTKIQNTLYLLEELQKTNPNWISIESILSSNLYETSLMKTILEFLYNHSSYRLVLDLSKKHNWEDLKFKSNLSLYLLEKTNTVPDFESNSDIMVSRIFSKKFESIFHILQNQEEKQTMRFLFYSTLKEKFNSFYFPLENIVCKKNDCSSLEDLEKKLLFKFLLDSLPYDTNQIAKNNLLYLLENFYTTSCLKGNLYLSKVIEKYVQNNDYNLAFEFYQYFSKNYHCIKNIQEIQRDIQDILYPLIFLKGMNYKIQDTLLLEFSKDKRNLIDLIDLIIKIINEPKENLYAIFKDISWNKIPEKYHRNLYDIFLMRFLKEKDYENFQNFAFLREQKSKQYKNKIQEIQSNLNPKEEWINIIEWNSNFYICKLRECMKDDLPADSLRKTLYRFFYESTYFTKQTIDLEELLENYTKLYTKIQNKDKFTYYWFDGIHKYHPFFYRENSIFVINPLEFKTSRKEFYYHQNYKLESKISKDNFYSSVFNSHLPLLLKYKNYLSNPNKTIWITQDDSLSGLFIKTIKKKKFHNPFLEPEEIHIETNFTDNAGIMYIQIDSPYILLNFIEKFYDNQNFPLENKLSRIYKYFFLLYPTEKEYWFIRPFTQNLIR